VSLDCGTYEGRGLKMGRPRTPTRLLKARGSKMARYRKEEPQPPDGIPKIPSWISKAGREHWLEIAGQLQLMGVLTRVDQAGLVLLVDALAQYIKARDEVDESGITTVTEKGYEIQRPVVAARNNAWERVLKLLKEYGLTASSRAGLKVENPVKKETTTKASVLRFPGIHGA